LPLRPPRDARFCLRASLGGAGNAVWRVVDAASGKRVVLVGTMHGNPASSNLAATVIKEEVPRAVLVELCDARWNVTAVSERARERATKNQESEEGYRERKRESARSRERAREREVEREVEREAGQLRT
jgi:hypothetical protein